MLQARLLALNLQVGALNWGPPGCETTNETNERAMPTIAMMANTKNDGGKSSQKRSSPPMLFEPMPPVRPLPHPTPPLSEHRKETAGRER